MSTKSPGPSVPGINAKGVGDTRLSRRSVVGAGTGLAALVTASWNGPIVARPGNPTRESALAQDDVETDVELVLPFDSFGQPITLDPHRTVNWGPYWVLLPHVWSGLLAFDENGGVVPDLAESVSPNEDATVWTAVLREGLAFASGNPLAAQDFVDSWLRAIDPAGPSPMASFMSDVAGVDEYLAGDGEQGGIGFAVVDDRTIEITLRVANSSFPAALATFVWAPLDLSVLADEAVADPFLANAGAGRWRFTELVDGERLVMEPNENYPGDPSPSVVRVVWQLYEGPDTQVATIDEYRADAVAIADVPLSLLPDVTGDEQLAAQLVSIESPSSTLAIGLDYLQPPFDDVRVRQAIAAAIDRESWASETWSSGFIASQSFIPPAVTVTSGYQPATQAAFDEARAGELLGEAASDPVAEAVDIVYYQPASDSPADIDRHAALLAQIEASTGIIVRHDTSMTREQISALQQDNGGRQFDLVWWWTVTDTPALLDTATRPGSQAMSGWFNWSADLDPVGEGDPGAAAATFTDLLDQARAATDADSRNALYQEAEQLMLDEAVLIPLGHWVQRFVQKPWLQGTRQGPWSGSIPVRIDQDVVIRGR